jgi:hypothetical protein
MSCELLLTAILADGIHPGLTRMAAACPGISVSTRAYPRQNALAVAWR